MHGKKTLTFKYMISLRPHYHQSLNISADWKESSDWHISHRLVYWSRTALTSQWKEVFVAGCITVVVILHCDIRRYKNSPPPTLNGHHNIQPLLLLSTVFFMLVQHVKSTFRFDQVKGTSSAKVCGCPFFFPFNYFFI